MHRCFCPRCSRVLLLVFGVLLAITLTKAAAQEGSAAGGAQGTRRPALFVVGDSIVKTGRGSGEKGPWGWGSELGALFDDEKIEVHNKGRGGRSSRSYIEEELWSDIVEQLAPGDFVLLHFGHNDARNSWNHPDRTTITGSGDETLEVGVGDERKLIHTYGWYLRQYVGDIQAKGATALVCSSAPRNLWVDGRIKRGLDGYAGWAEEAASASGAFFIDLNARAANRYDALGEAQAANHFADVQHTTKAGARLNAECVVEGFKALKDCPLTGFLAPSTQSPE